MSKEESENYSTTINKWVKPEASVFDKLSLRPLNHILHNISVGAFMNLAIFNLFIFLSSLTARNGIEFHKNQLRIFILIHLALLT